MCILVGIRVTYDVLWLLYGYLWAFNVKLGVLVSFVGFWYVIWLKGGI